MQEIAAEEDLPEKLLLVHQFDASMIEDRGEITDQPGVAVAFSIDGFGSPGLKRGVLPPPRATRNLAQRLQALLRGGLPG